MLSHAIHWTILVSKAGENIDTVDFSGLYGKKSESGN